MILATFVKQPAEVMAYDIDYRAWLAALADEGTSIVVTVPTGITKNSHSLYGGVLTMWISGGVSGVSYKFTLLLTTTAGRVKEDEIVIKVKNF